MLVLFDRVRKERYCFVSPFLFVEPDKSVIVDITRDVLSDPSVYMEVQRTCVLMMETKAPVIWPMILMMLAPSHVIKRWEDTPVFAGCAMAMADGRMEHLKYVHDYGHFENYIHEYDSEGKTLWHALAMVGLDYGYNMSNVRFGNLYKHIPEFCNEAGRTILHEMVLSKRKLTKEFMVQFGYDKKPNVLDRQAKSAFHVLMCTEYPSFHSLDVLSSHETFCLSEGKNFIEDKDFRPENFIEFCFHYDRKHPLKFFADVIKKHGCPERLFPEWSQILINEFEINDIQAELLACGNKGFHDFFARKYGKWDYSEELIAQEEAEKLREQTKKSKKNKKKNRQRDAEMAATFKARMELKQQELEAERQLRENRLREEAKSKLRIEKETEERQRLEELDARAKLLAELEKKELEFVMAVSLRSSVPGPSVPVPEPSVPEPSITWMEDSPCVVCMEKPRSCVYISCGHLCICEDCVKIGNLSGTCPICCQEGVQIRVYNP